LDPELRTSDASLLTPQRWRCDLEAVLPDNAIVFSDIGGHMLFNLQHLVIKEGQRFVINMGFGSMGHGTVAPIGAALSKPEGPIIAIIGDGCFTMNGMEMIAAVEYEIPVVWIVENNNMHGITWHGSKLLGKARKPLRSVRYRRSVEVASIARAMGLTSFVVDSPGMMQEVLSKALAVDGPALIEVRVDGSVAPPLGGRIRSLAGFIKR
jgi:acetolactate synthase-1/2/3 large subunit